MKHIENVTLYDTEEEALEGAAIRSNELLDNDDSIEFEGQNCEDWDEDVVCYGWNGKSRRCDCGNRRVGWTVTQDRDGKYYFYAEAW